MKKVIVPGFVLARGCVSAEGVFICILLMALSNANNYKDILEKNLLLSTINCQASVGEFLFQQDGAPCYKANNKT